MNYLTNEDRVTPTPIWTDVAKALELCTADVPTEYENEWESNGCQKIAEVCKKHGAERTIECMLRHLESEPTLELYWFARANIVKVAKYIEPYLKSKNEEEITNAIKSLIYFDSEEAWELMELIATGKSDIEFADKISWYFEDDLKRIGNDRALRLLKLMNE